MKEELEKLTEQVMRNGQAMLSGIKSETDRLLDEAVGLMDDWDRKKTWSGIDSVKLSSAPDTIVPGCMVLEGGSFRGCYTSGVLDVLMENGINLQTTIGTSAGALNGYNYVAGEIGRAAKINLGYRHDRRYMGPRTLARNRGVVGFDFLLNEVEEEIPFNRERFEDPNRRFLVTVTNCETGQVRYCEKGITPDFQKAVQASASMPFVSDMVEVDGVPCLDGGCAVKIPYRWALDNGFEKILVVRTRPAEYRRPQETKAFTEITERIYRNYPQLVELLDNQSEQYNGACRELEQLQEQGKLLMLCPSGSISVSAIEGDMERLGALYLLGRADAKLMLPQIRAYFGLTTDKAE
ncbi:MAG: patatin family protein [Clostridiales bacterium]|nr:patatin family protein [Clostridiales bacterium]